MQNTTDPIIGIDARGKVFYTHLSTLVNSSSEGSYFDRRFNSDLPPGACRKDDIGRDVYFVDRSAELFEHILNYLTEGRRSWPTYQADSVLWERLYREAQFYGLDDLCSMLQTTHDCPYNPHLSTRAKCKGILYWLGTKMTGSYQNPADTGLVEAEVNCSGYEPDISQNKSEAIANFFQYRPLVNEKDGETNCVSTGFDILFLQAGEEESQDVKIKFPSISIKPTHISLRCNSYINLTYFKFEASKDGLTWIPLLKVKPDVKEEVTCALATSEEDCERYEQQYRERNECLEYKIDRREFMTDIAEENHRAFWKLDQSPSSEHFYSYFRIVAPNFVEFIKDDDDLNQQAREEAERLHQGQSEEAIQCATFLILVRNDILCEVISGVGFEIYGEVCEMEL